MNIDLAQVFEMVSAQEKSLVEQLTSHGLSLDATEYRRGQIASLRWVLQIPAMKEEDEQIEREQVEWLK